jgi:hypothetical protein
MPRHSRPLLGLMEAPLLCFSQQARGAGEKIGHLQGRQDGSACDLIDVLNLVGLRRP